MPREVIERDTPIVWKDSGGSAVMTLQNLAAAAWRVGARYDLGAGMTRERYEWRFTVQFATPPVVAETIALYLATSDGTSPDGGVGVADAAGNVDWITNMKSLGNFTVTSINADHAMTISGVVTILTRYVSPMIHNNTADNLKNTANTSSFTLTPILKRSP